LFLVSVMSSYWAIRNNDTNRLNNLIADASFFAGVLLLSLSVVIAATIL
jgi:hypothetical protein